MNIGQMSFKKLSEESDYLQLDICGLNKEEALERYKKYNKDIPVILHGDWKKKGFSENNLDTRYLEYIEIINSLKEITKVIGITIHPPARKFMNIDNILTLVKEIEDKTKVLVFIENRSNKSLNISTPEEIVGLSKHHLMTIDIPQLYISCGYDIDKLYNVLGEINHDNVYEYHFANILKKGKHTFVARNILNGDLDLKYIFNLLNKSSYFTLEILGGINTFNINKNVLNKFASK